MNNLTSFAGLHIDLISFVLSALLLGGYQYYLYTRLKRDKFYTVQAVNALARAAWVENIMHGGKDILAVQTLRNSTMAATFLASTAVLLIMGTLTLTAQAEKFGATWHALNIFGTTATELWLGKLALLLVDLFVAFFSFSMSIRIYNHVGYMINVPLSYEHKTISPQHVASHLNRGGWFYSIGMRAFYYTVPMVFWLFDPLLMFFSAIGLIVVLYRIDRAPHRIAGE